MKKCFIFFEKNGFWLGFGLLLLLMAWYFQGLWAEPNGFLGIHGDGYKNYASVEYHVKNDATYHRFEGMNYPYSDHVVFADAQPILANGIKFFCNHFFDISKNTRAIIHSFLLLSILACFGFIYLIFRELAHKKAYASLVACGITCLSPQLARLDEHYALGYLFALPALLYFLLLFYQKKEYKYSFLIAILTVFVAQIHLYYLGIIVLFVSFFHFFHLFFFQKINIRAWKIIGNQALHYGIQVLIPVVFIAFYWLKIGDTIKDRPAVPNGFLTYKALWQGLFSHQNSLVFGVFSWKTPYIFSMMENVVYLGISVGLAGIFFLIKNIYYRSLPKKNEENSFLLISFCAALPLFLLALGLPFILFDWEKYLEHTGALQQFRGVGRFAWVFFYVINIYVFSTVDKWQGRFKMWITFFFPFVLLIDAMYLHREPIKVLPANFLSKDVQHFENDSNIDWKKYQAIMPLPFFHIGSEQFDISPEILTLPKVFHFCIEKKLPCMGAQMSRISFEQMYRSQRFALAENEEKPLLLGELKTEKPILIIQNKGAFVKDTIYNTWNHFPLRYLTEDRTLRFYECNLEWKNESQNIDSTVENTKKMLLCEKNVVFKGNLKGQKANQTNVLSFDWLCSESSQPLLEYEIRELEVGTGKQLHYLHYGCRYFRADMKNNHYVSCTIPFETWYADSEIEVTLFYDKAKKDVPLFVKNLNLSTQ